MKNKLKGLRLFLELIVCIFYSFVLPIAILFILLILIFENL
jgi:hypothetical protein